MSEVTCKGTKKDGSPCESNFVGDDGYCSAHSPNAGSEEMARRGRKGAEVTNERRKSAKFDASELPALENMPAVRAWAEAVGRALADGRIGEKKANSMARLLRQVRGALTEEAAGKIQELREQLEAVREKVESEQPWKKAG